VCWAWIQLIENPVTPGGFDAAKWFFAIFGGIETGASG
jgi:hypothetical protein